MSVILEGCHITRMMLIEQTLFGITENAIMLSVARFPQCLKGGSFKGRLGPSIFFLKKEFWSIEPTAVKLNSEKGIPRVTTLAGLR